MEGTARSARKNLEIWQFQVKHIISSTKSHHVLTSHGPWSWKIFTMDAAAFKAQAISIPAMLSTLKASHDDMVTWSMKELLSAPPPRCFSSQIFPQKKSTPCVRSQQSSGVYTGGFQQSCVSRTPKKKSGSVYSRSGTCKHGIVEPDNSEALVQIANFEIQSDFAMESKNSRNSIPSRTTRRKLRNATPQTSIDPNPQKQSLPGR